MRDELARVSLALAQSQRDTLAQVGGQLTSVVGDFHRRLAEFGQQVQGGQASTGEALQKGLEEARRTLPAQLEGLVGTVNAQLASRRELAGSSSRAPPRCSGS